MAISYLLENDIEGKHFYSKLEIAGYSRKPGFEISRILL